MQTAIPKLLLTIIVGLSLAGCMQTAREQVEAAVVDDDALCQKNAGPPGSNAYAACMKDRDVARAGSQARMDRAHRRVSEDMLNSR
jgi:hypothetical protein